MKKGYKRLLLFELLLFIILILNSFFKNVLSNYGIIIFMILVLIVFKFRFGFEKDRHRYIKDIILNTLIFLVTFFILYYLLGILIGFYRPGNYFTLYGFRMYIFPLTFYILLREYLRYLFLTKSEGNKLLIITTCILFIMFDVTNSIYYASFSDNRDTFLFVVTNLLPAISANISLCYVCFKMGYKSNILYGLSIGLFQYILPLVPNPNEYFYSLIYFFLPVVYAYTIYNFFVKLSDDDIDRNYLKNKHKFISLVPVLALVMVLVYFISGYFYLWAISIASGSMEPNIHKGDIVIIEKTKNYNKIKTGDVLAYNYNNKIIVHRVYDLQEIEGRYYFVTKGDANNNIDNLIIEEDMIVGVVNFRIPYAGMPTIWVNELWNK